MNIIVSAARFIFLVDMGKPMGNILTVTNLKKNYKEVKAVNDISLTVKEGELFCLLGKNGAGKTTSINIIITLLKKDAGEVFLHDSSDTKYIRNNIGVLFQENIFDSNLTVKENILFYGSLYIKSKTKIEERYNEIRELLQLQEFENKRFCKLSGGQKRKAEIGRSLFTNPKILFLDEPTTGLDPETRVLVWKILKDLQVKFNTTLFLTTHYMEEAALADTIVIIDKGIVVCEGSPLSLKERYSFDTVIIETNEPIIFKKYLELNNFLYSQKNDIFEISIKDSEDSIKIISDNKDIIKNLEVKKGNMDDVFIRAVGGK